MSEQQKMALLSMKPYLLRMYWEYIQANGMVPHILVMADVPGVEVPRHLVKNGTIVLNISYNGTSSAAAKDLLMRDDFITFQSSFGQKMYSCKIPVEAVRYIVARENPEIGCFFEGDIAAMSNPPETPEPPEPPKPTVTGEKTRPNLRVVK